MFTEEFKNRLDMFIAQIETRADMLKMISMKSETEYKRETRVIDDIEELGDLCYDTVTQLMEMELKFDRLPASV